MTTLKVLSGAENSGLNLSVRELVEFVCREGDLLFQPGPTAQEGIAAHQKLQKQCSETTQAEFSVSGQFFSSGETVSIRGRVDLLHPEEKIPHLEEIKTIAVAFKELADSQKNLHWAQLKVYGCCYLLGNPDHTQCQLSMIWYNVQTQRLHREQQQFNQQELMAFTQPVIDSYMSWYQKVRQLKSAIQQSAQSLAFPFQVYRPGQREMAVAVYRCLQQQQRLMINAPTGIGKTISTLFPALKALGEGLIDKIIYLTAKKTGREAARDALERMQRGGLNLTYLEIQAKKSTCVCTDNLNELGVCTRKLGFYDRLPEARSELLARRHMTPAVIADVAQAYQLCPFELSLQMIPWVSVVICDFNYVFDPLVRLSWFSDSTERKALLVDETHNLIPRSRAMYSVQINRFTTEKMAQLHKSTHPQLTKAIRTIARTLKQWGESREQPVNITREVPQKVIQAVNRFMEVCSQLYRDSEGRVYETSIPEALSEWMQQLLRFRKIASLMLERDELIVKEAFRIVSQAEEGRAHDQTLILQCLDAGEFLYQAYTDFTSIVYFSATLEPFHFSREMLGIPSQSQQLSLKSPFRSDQSGIFICPYIDTRFQQRQQAVPPLIELIFSVYSAKDGNYMVYFPSYRFMEETREAFVQRYPDVAVVMQKAGASDQERSDFINRFSEGERYLGFAIMGGVYGEGVDFVGEKLLGVIVVGTGLPAINREQELLKDYYNRQYQQGFDFAYRYPGMIRVLQTAGRVIRSDTDKGVVILVDQRFQQPFYQRLYPGHWVAERMKNSLQLMESLDAFWLT